MQQEICFVTGKGGVGKSTFAASLAYKKAKEGKKVLLVELGDFSFFQDFLNLPPVGFSPVLYAPNIWISLWTGHDCLRNYVKYLIKIESLTRLLFENNTTRTLIDVAPGLRELSILGQITSGPRQHGPVLPFDCFVIDCFATGHFMSLLRAPVGLSKAIKYGPMHDQSESIDRTIRNLEICSYYVVTLPEELPFKESTELIDQLKTEFGITPTLVINKVLKAEISNEALNNIEKNDPHWSEFLKFLNGFLEREKKFREQAKKDWSLEIPMIFSNDPNTVIMKMAEKIP